MKSRLVRAFSTPRKTKKPARRRSPRRRLGLQHLEDRRLLAAIVGDDGHGHEFPGTIPPGAIETANGGFDVRRNVRGAEAAMAGVNFTTAPSTQVPEDLAIDFLRNNAGLFNARASDFEEVVVSSQSTSSLSGATHVYLQQQYNGIDVFGGRANVSISPAGQVLYAASSFAPDIPGTLNTTTPTKTAEQAIAAAAQNLGITVSGSLTAQRRDNDEDRSAQFTGGGVSDEPIPVKLEIFPMSAAQSRLVWNLVISHATTPDVFEMNVDAVSGQVLSRLNWTSYASYRVFPLPLESPQDGPGLPASHQLVQDPAHPTASPFGWHDSNGVPGPEFTDTRGNNVDAFEDRDANGTGTRPDGGQALVFDFPFDPTQAPSANVNEAVTNLFYWNNIVHDVMALNGFDEAAGNFQARNYSGAGLGSDHVMALAQLGAAQNTFNNAFFASTPDGRPPTMGMFEFALTTPNRDSSNAAEIIVHEYFHGVSHRLIGGPNDVSTLGGIQSDSMGEGWSDFFSLVFTAKPTDTASDSYPVGTYVLGQPQNGPGIRRFPYSTNTSVNPLTYNDIDILQSEVCTILCDEVHNAGEIWASALWDLYWLLVNRDGFDPDLYTGTGGNNLAMRLVTEGMKFTASQPTMLDARDGIIAADQAITGGANFREIWTAFAGRGMGFSADDGGGHNDVDVTEAFDLPPAQVTGVKFSDLDRDGMRDAIEPGLEGWTIYADLDRDGARDPDEPSTLTDANGAYRLDLRTVVQRFGPGAYDIREEVELGWQQTFPRPGLPSDASPPSAVILRDGFYTVTIATENSLIGGVNFGNFGAPGEIRGVKFFDEDGNGVRGPSEAGQPGVTIRLFDEQGNVLQQTTTGPDGSYEFIDLPPGTYAVDEIVPPDQTKTFPTANGGLHIIDLQPTQIRIDAHFGNFGLRGAISGRKFDDANGNGLKDPDELGVRDVIIYVDRNLNETFDLGEPSATTDQFGFYRIGRMVPGSYVVREFIEDGSTQTTPGGAGSQQVTVIAGRETQNVNFGNRDFFDFGDAPAPYRSSRAQNGAFHGIRPGFHLGRRVDDEDDSLAGAVAGDDNPASAFVTGQTTFPVGALAAPVSAITADLDSLFNSGLGPDMVVVNQTSSGDPARGSVSVLLSNGDGTFAEAVEYLVGAQPSRAAVGDFNGDGRPDLAVSNTGSNNVTVLLNRGDGTFLPAEDSPFDAGPSPQGIAAADFDGDGDADLAVGGNDGIVRVLMNTRLDASQQTLTLSSGGGVGAAALPSADTLGYNAPLEFGINEGPIVDLTVGDMNRDGRPDLIGLNRDDDSFSVLLNQGVVGGEQPGGVVGGEQSFSPGLDFAVGDQPLDLTLGDFNRDGRLDVATANASGTSSVAIGRGDGTFFPRRDFVVGGAPSSLAAADFNADGFLDLGLATGTPGRASLLLNDGAGRFTPGQSFVGGSELSRFIGAGDFNRDGAVDAALVNPLSGDMRVFTAAGDDEDGVVFSPQPLVRGNTASVQVTASAAGVLNGWFDFNGDGDWDDLGEHVFRDRELVEGANNLFLSIPSTSSLGFNFARFRFGDERGLGPIGPGGAGEVEDHGFTVADVGGVPSSPFTNPQNALDVNADGAVTLFDALMLVNDLQANGGPRALPPTTGPGGPPFLDPSGDRAVTLNDVLLVVNELLRQITVQGSGLAGEGEAPITVSATGDEATASSAVILLQPSASEESAAGSSEDSVCHPAEAGAEETSPLAAPRRAGVSEEPERSLAVSEEDDWDETLEAIAGDVSSAWEAENAI